MLALVLIFAVLGFALISTKGDGVKPKYPDETDSLLDFTGKHNSVVLPDEFYDLTVEEQNYTIHTLDFLRRKQ